MRYVSVGEVIGLLIIAAVLGGTVVLGVRECNRKQRCEDNGGKVENYNCRWVMMSCGDGCFYPVEACDWRCLGGSAEARP